MNNLMNGVGLDIFAKNITINRAVRIKALGQ
jgi:hypothetical protein